MAIIQRIIIFFMSILAFLGIGRSVQPQDQDGDIAACSLAQESVEFSFVSNPSTGYSWTFVTEGESVALTAEQYERNSDPMLVGAPGTQYYTFTAVKTGKTTITFTYSRRWENKPPAYTYVAEITIDEERNITLNSFSAR